MKHLYQSFILISVLITMAFHAIGQNDYLSMRHFTEEAGLVTNGINERQSIVQDSQGFIWLGTENGLLRYDGYGFKKFLHEPNDSNSLSSSYVTELLIDQQGALWIGTDAGLDRYIPSTGRFQHVLIDESPLQQNANFILDLHLDSDGALWAVTKSDLLRWHPGEAKADSFIELFKLEKAPNDLKLILNAPGKDRYLLLDGENRLFLFQPKEANSSVQTFNLGEMASDDELQVYTAYSTSENSILLGTNKGLLLFDDGIDTLGKISSTSTVEINDIAQASDGSYCLATNLGLCFMSSLSSPLRFYQHQRFEPYSSSRDEIQVVFFDDHDNLWIGTRGHGIDKLSKKTKDFKYHNALTAKGKIAIGEITCVQRWEEGNYLIGSSKGLYVYDMNRQQFRLLQSSDSPLSNAYITAALADIYGQFWISTQNHGLFALDNKGNLLSHIHHSSHPEFRECISQIWSLAQDSYGNIWAGTLSGVFVVEASSRKIDRCYSSKIDREQMPGETVRSIFTDSKNRVWMGTSAGLSMWNDASRSFRHFSLPDQGKGRWLSGKNEIGSICEGNKGSLWIKTLSGIYNFNPLTQAFTALQFPQGLQASMVHSLITDLDGNLWISAMNGIWLYDYLTGTYTHFGFSDGIESVNFNANSLLEKEGHILFCGKEGFLRFHPDQIRNNPFVPPVHITEISLFHNPLVPTLENSPLQNPANYTNSIKLNHKQNMLGFEFSALNYTSTEDNEYAYILEGFDEDWQYVGNRRTAYYTNLDPGKYTFRVKGSNNDNIWNEEATSLTIHILPPWWNTTLAYISYLLVALGIVYLAYVFQINRLELRHRLAMEHQESKRLKELDKTKSELYANITHEFRTPLTLISGMAAEIREDPDTWVGPGVEVIKINSANLLNLVNQMLDLNKLESGKLPLQEIQGDIIRYSKYIHQSFETFAATQDIQVHFISGLKSLNMDYDPEKYLQILSNLLSNAIKFTPKGGNVYLSVNEIVRKEKSFFEIRVKDTGKGIGPEVHQIFERYFQGEYVKQRSVKGTGIGLALTRDLIHLMGGTISVKSVIGHGAEFIVNLPVRQVAPPEETVFDKEELKKNTEGYKVTGTESLISSKITETGKTKNPVVLLIEDNLDVAAYISNCIAADFNIEHFPDAESGIQYATQEIPDLILLDLQLPGMDGHTFCSQLKEDERTSHIPVIVLTAAADKETKLKLLSLGVEDYITKPFDKEELNQRLINILNLRKKMQEQLRNKTNIDTSPGEASTRDEAFIAKFRKIIEDHIDDDGFSVTHLCREMGLSRTQLHNKIKALTGKSTSLFVRLIRLQKARTLLDDPELNVSQVAYDVGFKDPNYFSRCFAEEFGYPPSKVPG